MGLGGGRRVEKVSDRAMAQATESCPFSRRDDVVLQYLSSSLLGFLGALLRILKTGLYIGQLLLEHLQLFIVKIPGRVMRLRDTREGGGFLRGYRDIAGNNDDSGFDHLISITSGQNVVIENVHMSMATEDGLTINSSRHAYEADYVPSKNVSIKGCTFDSNRRLGLSITDGQDIIVEDCIFLNSGIDVPNSLGAAPRFGLDIEPVGHADAQPMQKVDRVIIRNNYEENSAGGGIILMDGDDILVTGNIFKRGVYSSAASNVRIVDNPFLSTVVVGALDAYGVNRNENTIISGNTIKNGSAGIQAYNRDVQIFDNDIIDCALAIQLNSLKDSRIYDNRIYSRGKDGDGINAINYVDNVIIENNDIDVDDKPFYFAGVNSELEEHGYTFTFKNNTINSGASALFQYTFGGILLNNTFKPYGINLDGVNNFTLDGNHIISNYYTGIEIGKDVTNNVVIKKNTVECLNPSAAGSAIFAEETNGTEEKNIVISDNILKAENHHSGISITGYNGISVFNNTGTPGYLGSLIKYRGNNSTFTNNKTLSGAISNDIIGDNNTIID